MTKISTPYIQKEDMKKEERRVLSPCSQRLDFLKQFARAYRVEPQLENNLAGLILN